MNDQNFVYEEVDMSDAKNSDSENEAQEAARVRRPQLVVKKDSVLGLRSPQQQLQNQQTRIMQRPGMSTSSSNSSTLGSRLVSGQKVFPVARSLKVGQLLSPQSMKRKPDGSPLVVQLGPPKRLKPGEARLTATPTPRARIQKTAQVQTEMTADDMNQYEQIIDESQERIAALEETVRKLKYTPEMFENDDRRTQYFTGLESFVNMVTLFNTCEGHLPASNSVTKFEIFILTLLRLRLKIPIQLLGYMFGVPAKKANYFYNEGISVLHMVMRDIFAEGLDMEEVH